MPASEQARYGRAIKYKYATLYKEDVIAQLADEQRIKQAEWNRDEEERRLARFVTDPAKLKPHCMTQQQQQ